MNEKTLDNKKRNKQILIGVSVGLLILGLLNYYVIKNRGFKNQ